MDTAFIDRQDALDQFCERLASESWLTVDTEFMRETTYWPRLCVVQVAGENEAAAIDTLAGLNLQPLWDLLCRPGILKVMHASRQDMEIFLKEIGRLPAPVFDTQIAAMVCGFGESVGYDKLVSGLTGQRIDKLSRFADWAQRPLTKEQIAYAIADVTHLRVVYMRLQEQLAETGRASWVDEEMAALAEPDLYTVDPREVWKRLKIRTDSPKFLAVLREVAAWREHEAQRRDVPRSRVVRDDTLLDIAAQAPQTPGALERARGLSKGFASSKAGAGLLEAVATGLAVRPADRPKRAKREPLPVGLQPVVDLLKVLLRLRAEEHGVAQRLVAASDDLEAMASQGAEADTPALRGWRRDVFGAEAMELMDGRLTLGLRKQRVRAIRQDLPAAD